MYDFITAGLYKITVEPEGTMQLHCLDFFRIMNIESVNTDKKHK